MIINIVPVNENFRGMSYGDWAAVWTRWLFSEDPSAYYGDQIIFLRGNVNYEPAGGVVGAPRHFDASCIYDRTGHKGETIYEQTALFIPIITVTNILGTTFEGTVMDNEIDLRSFANTDINGSREIWGTIRRRGGTTQRIARDLQNFRIESPIFRLRISPSSPLIDKMEGGPLIPGVYDALTAGYFLIVRSLPPSRYRIPFGGRGYGTYVTNAAYDITVKGIRPRCTTDMSGVQTKSKRIR